MKSSLLPPMQRRILGTVGTCIYCGSTDKLSDEHVIPFALGGRDELHDASCPQCADATSLVERRILQSPAMWPLRRVLELPSRRNKRQPNSFRARDKSTSPPTDVELSVADYPLVVPFFLFDSPGLLSGVAPAEHAVGRAQLWKPRPLANKVPLELDMRLSADDVARLLAKIALGYAVAEHTLEAFEEIYVRSVVLGDLRGVNLWVGCSDGATSFKDGRMHGALVGSAGEHVSVAVQLFRAPAALPQMPIYQVLVGRLKAAA